MKPGIYDITNEAYHESDGLSRSGIMELKRSGLHYVNYKQEKNLCEKSPSCLYLGSALHTYILEPDNFLKLYFVADKCEQRSKAGKERMAEIKAEAGERQLLTTEEFAQIEAMGQSFLSDKIAPQFLKNSQIEKSIFWNDPATDVLLKARPDIWRGSIIADLKTSKDASPYSAARDMATHGYHIQAAMCADAIYAITGKKILEHVLIIIEKTPPYALAIYPIDDDAIKKGREEYKHYVKSYRDFEEDNVWPSYKLRKISLPSYYV